LFFLPARLDAAYRYAYSLKCWRHWWQWWIWWERNAVTCSSTNKA